MNTNLRKGSELVAVLRKITKLVYSANVEQEPSKAHDV